MCLQCSTDAIVYGRDILPGWQLMCAQKNAGASEPFEWAKDQLGLVRMNDPSVVFTVEPAKDPFAGMTDEEEDAVPDGDPRYQESEAHYQAGKRIDEDVCASADPRTVYEIIKAAIEVGYSPDEGPMFGFWLCDRMARWIEANPPISHSDMRE